MTLLFYIYFNGLEFQHWEWLSNNRVCMSAQLCQMLCGPMDCSLPGSSVEFSRQEYWGGLPFFPLEGLPDPGIEPASLASAALVD